jgi:hypothetical protein
MKTWIAILFTVGLFVLTVLISTLIDFDLSGLMILATSLWAALDSSRIELKRYHSYIAHGPIILFLACGLLWIICFPWYLAVRYKIKHGTAILKTQAEEALDRKGAMLQAKCVALFLVTGVAAGWFWGGWPYGVGFGAIGGLVVGVLIGGGLALVIRSRSRARAGAQPASALEKSF